MNKLGIRRRFSKLKRSSTPLMQFVDLGLPSGTLWATTNIGAKTPYEAGLYFAWGETDGYKGSDVGTKHNFVLTEYKYYEGTLLSGQYTKYNANDLKTILDLEDDAAFVNCGGNLRMPTKEQFAELINDEYVTKVYDNTNKGYIITSKINGNSIFLVNSLMASNRPVSIDYGWTVYISNEKILEVPGTCYAMLMHPEDQLKISAFYAREGGYNIRPVHDRTLTFKATDDYNTIKIGLYNKRASGLQDANFEYSLDDGKTWNQYTINTLISLQKNNTIKFRGINNALGAYQAGYTGYHYFIMTGSFEASGDVTSLLNNIGGNYALTYNYSFYDLFKDCTALQVAPNLPSTVLSELCYCGMFIGCTNLRIAPKLPAMSMLRYCYSSMFNGCTSLILAPDLPATTLEDRCYQSMFKGCTSLLRAPILPAVNLKVGCYNYMFLNCSSLNYIKALFITDPGLNYTNYWVDGVAETGTFVKSSDANWDLVGTNGVPVGWNITSLGELKFIALLASSTISLTKVGSPANVSLLYSTDNNTWNTYTIGDVITLTNIGDSVKFKGINSTLSNSTGNYYQFQMTGSISASGDVTSLLNGVGGNVNLTGKEYCFCKMFYDCNVLTHAPNLPSTEISNYCYYNMFFRCTSLIAAPDLPATTIADYCYSYMFNGCSALITVPTVLPAMTLANSCYANMFYHCTSLTKAPELPATILAKYCYSSMFQGCTSLTTAPALPVTTLTSSWFSCYDNMFYGCTSLTVAPELPATTLADSCYYRMFYGCTSLIEAPDLPATTLKFKCYYNMFYGCTSLNKVTCLATDISARYCTQDWLLNVSSTGTFIKDPSISSWSSGDSGIPTGWTIETASE